MNYLGVVSLLICFAITLPGVRRRKDADLYLLIGVLVRFASVLFYSYMGDADPDGYGAMALMYSHMTPEQLILNFPTGAYFYSWLISFPYRLFGPNEMMIRSINGLLYCCSLFISYDLAKSLYGEKPAKKVALFLAVFPAIIRFSGPFASREALFVWLSMQSLLLLYQFYNGEGSAKLLLAIPCILFACIVHTSAFMFFVLLFLIMMNNSSGDKGMQILIGFIGCCVVAAGLFFMFKKGIGTEKLYLDKGGMSLEKMNWISEASADGRAAYLKGFTFTNPVLTALFLPVRAAFFLYAPFIWMVRNALDVFGFIDGALYLLVTYHAVQNIRAILEKLERTRNEKFVLFLTVMLLGMLAMFAVGTSNYGTALRHRAKLISMLVLLCGPFFDYPMHIVRRDE